ncbi:MAG TPA: peptide chain release factor-like protein [Anaeromyxobacteraceae bacterium]|nr:peptide chain release factor-like protein [Anaeromyxobacteraceae bacterium]
MTGNGELRAAARRTLSLGDEALLAECTEEFLVAGGPGGQHRNKAATGVRLVHLPTRTTVTAFERRSQSMNRGAALRRLRDRLEAMARTPRPRVATRPTRASRERRLSEKRRRGDRKAARRGPDRS